MVRDRAERLILRGGAVHEGRWPERRLGHGAAIEEQAAVRGVDVEPRRQFHEQIVRVLAIGQLRGAVGGLAGGEQIGIALRPHRGLQAHHRP
ncbi:hypothetical protein D9M73_163890 [compost metagenome]